MSFQTYIDNITKKTKQTPYEIKKYTIEQGILKPDFEVTGFCNWLANEYQ